MLAQKEITYVSFTSDAWSSDVNDTSLPSLTAHWIDSQFKRISAVLSAQCLTEAHTGQYIAAQFLTMLEKWDISLERVHLVITDNSSNMKKTMLDSSLQHFGCFAHSLQLVIQDGLLSQRAVIDIIAICKSIVGHFHHSSVASHNPRKPQCSTAQTDSKYLNIIMSKSIQEQTSIDVLPSKNQALCEFCTHVNQLKHC